MQNTILIILSIIVLLCIIWYFYHNTEGFCDIPHLNVRDQVLYYSPDMLMGRRYGRINLVPKRVIVRHPPCPK